MARELDMNEQELFNLIMEFIVGEGISLDGFNAVTQAVKREYGKCVL